MARDKQGSPVLTGRAARACTFLSPLFLVASAVLCSPVHADTVVKKPVDPLHVRYEGLELNGDEFSDAVIVNLASGEKRLFLGSPQGTMKLKRYEDLSEEEKDILPDMITELDLNGDRVSELVVVNRRRLFSTADKASFFRALEHSVFFGQPDGTFKNVRLSRFSEVEKEALLFHAQLMLLPPEDSESGTGGVKISGYQ